MATDFTGIVLAGGRSTRMGRDKAGLPWNGGTLLDHMVALLGKAGASRVLVSGDRPSHRGIPDAWPGRGPVAGLASVLPHCPDGVAVVVPVDLPLIAAGSIGALADAIHAHAAACYAGHPVPLALRVDAGLRMNLPALVTADPRGPSLRSLLQGLSAVEVAIADGSTLRACNTPAQWSALAG